jgi:hypothetical protein
MTGTFTYTNNLGIVKKVIISEQKNGQFHWLGFEMRHGECCFSTTMSKEQHEETFKKFQKNYPNFRKIS